MPEFLAIVAFRAAFARKTGGAIPTLRRPVP
jgi:hypothetical protein